jgi:hypothetical protein
LGIAWKTKHKQFPSLLAAWNFQGGIIPGIIPPWKFQAASRLTIPKKELKLNVKLCKIS